MKLWKLSEDIEVLTEAIAPDQTKLKEFIKSRSNGDITFAKLNDTNEYSLIIK